ncbi:MAG TPA: hypothetical protein H9948_06820 [Candidatus Jeotgalibaca merdavium]|uniref:Phage protein n=1 Tax=Candidatus Jeotgalibaca merdavium TaxID=2838627 RepID=A0A9D2I1U6_9LACT|nr:hypothetical protein [Candidatus Jeotgalibaca merdavium]
MSKNKFKLNRSGVRELLQSKDMQAALEVEASAIRNRAGVGYKQDTYVGKNRANAMVWADTYPAKRDNMKNNTLLKAVR